MSSDILQNGTSKLLGLNSNGPSSPSECLYANVLPFENKTKGDSDSRQHEVLYENVHNLRRKQGNPSLPNLNQNIIYDVPKSNECIYSQPKSNASVDALIPQAAKLVLAQTPKYDSGSVDSQDRSDSESDGFDVDSVPSIPPTDYDSFISDDFLDVPYADYGLQVIHEETESQMSEDSDDQELDRCAEFCSETIRQRKRYDDEVQHFGLSSASLQGAGSLSPISETQDIKAEKALPDEIILKHIRIPPDWDPTEMLKRIFVVAEPKSAPNSTGVGMEGHMQILSGNRKRGTFWNCWKRKFCIASAGKLNCYDKSDCQDLFQSINLSGGKVDFLDPVEFVGKEQGKSMINRILGLDDGKGHYYVFQCSSIGEAARWIETLQQEMKQTNSFAIPSPSLPKNPSLYRDIILVDIGSTNIRAGILQHSPTLPALFFPAVMSTNPETGKTLYGNEVYCPENRKISKIRFPFESASKMCQNTVDMKALEGFLKKIFSSLNVVPNNYRVILTLPRRVDNKCRTSILQLLFNDFKVRSSLLCHQTVISFWSHSVDNGIVVDIGERCDVVPVSQGFVLSNAWGKAPLGGHVLQHFLRQGLGPQENGLYLSTPAENIALRFISENFVCVNGGGGGGRKLSQASQEIVVEMELRDVLPVSHLIGVDQAVLKNVAEGFFEPGLYGLDCESIQKIIQKSLQDCSVDIRKEMSQNIFLVGGSTLIPGFPERLQYELNQLCPAHLTPKIQFSPYRYHASFLGASVLSSTEAYEKSLLKSVDYDGGPGPCHWLI